MMYISQADSYSYYYQSTAASASNSTKSEKSSSGDFFSAVDTSQDGSVDQSELTTLMSNLAEETGQSINVEEQFSEYDADGDGTYTSEELKSFMDANRPEPSDMAELESVDDTAEKMGAGGRLLHHQAVLKKRMMIPSQ
ncbi:hypothetical protein ACMC5R_13615 [Deferribacteres bacterium DY0037]|nr:EF-hand domain-containing protein [Denitrovibrio acetiphilus]